MTVKNLLVHIDNSETAHQRVTRALQLAENNDAHLTGIYAYQTIVVPTYGEMAMPSYVYSELRSRAIEQENLAKASFEKWTQHWKDLSSWIAMEGDPPSIIANVAAHHDFLFMSQGLPGGESGEYATFLNRVIVESASPVIVVPAIDSSRNFGHRILVAWNGKKEVARAVRDALPLLQAAEAVEVVSINAPKDVDLSCADIAKHLSRHGVNINCGNTDTKSKSTGEAILYLAQNFDADMIVMGAYGHSRLREYILGGATRHILEKSSLPVLLSH